MDSSERGAMMLVRFTAVALIGFSLAEIAMIFAVSSKVPVTALSFILYSLPGMVGLLMLVKARAIAEWLDDLLDG
jgi:hypothetical protein